MEKIRTRVLAQVDQQRQATTKATLAYVLDAWLRVHEAERTTIAENLLQVEVEEEPHRDPRTAEQHLRDIGSGQVRCPEDREPDKWFAAGRLNGKEDAQQDDGGH